MSNLTSPPGGNSINSALTPLSPAIKNLTASFEQVANGTGNSINSNTESQIKFANGAKEALVKFINVRAMELTNGLRHVAADKVDNAISTLCDLLTILKSWYSTINNLFMMSSKYHCLLENTDSFLDEKVVGRVLFYLHADLMEAIEHTIHPTDRDAIKATIAGEGKKQIIATFLQVVSSKMKEYSEELKILALRKISSDVIASNVKGGINTVGKVFTQLNKDVRTIKVIDPTATITNEMLSLCFEAYIKLLPIERVKEFNQLQEKVIMKAAILNKEVSRDKDVLEFLRLAEIETERCPDIKVAETSSSQVTALTASVVQDMISKSNSKLKYELKRERPSDGKADKSPKKGKYTPEERKQYCINMIAKMYDLVDKKASKAEVEKVKGILRRLKDVKLEEREKPPKPASMQGKSKSK